jgi:hypothetical protein
MGLTLKPFKVTLQAVYGRRERMATLTRGSHGSHGVREAVNVVARQELCEKNVVLFW